MKISHFLWSTITILALFIPTCFATNKQVSPINNCDTNSSISLGNQINPDYFYDVAGNLKNGLPSQIATVITNILCVKLLANDAIEPDPSVVPKIYDISIQLRTSCSIRKYQLEQLTALVDDPDFDVNKSVVVACSGWNTNADEPTDVLEGLAKAYNCRGDTNFLSIDFGRYMQTKYAWSVLNTQIIGRYVAEALVNLTQVVPLQNLHLIGHSLGAQIVGVAARHFQRLTGKQVPRVTGFDPSNACFNYGQKVTTLSASDAAYVDIIHTSPGASGQSVATGDADFFVGGHFTIQNGCSNVTCSHKRSWMYYMESVYSRNENNFLSKRCDSLFNLQNGLCVGREYPMGYAAPRNLSGEFILEVSGSEPFGKNATSSFTSSNSECGTCRE